MRRLTNAMLALSLVGLACSFIAGQTPTTAPTAAPDTLETAVAATLTALAPTSTGGPAATVTAETPAPTETPTGVPAPSPTNTAPPAPGTTCSLAYADGAHLFCLEAAGTARILAMAPGAQQIWDPSLSSDGRLVAYVQGVLGTPSELWVASADPALGPPRALVTAASVPSPDPGIVWFPRRHAWRAGTHSLFFDTGWQPAGGVGGPGEYINNDLWLADADAGTTALLLGAQVGGNWAASPDGNFVAFTYPTGVGLVNADGNNLRRDLVTFAGISTYSEYAFKPDVYWQANGLAFNLAVPSADPLAPDPSATLYRVGTDGIVQTLATVPGNFVFGGLIRPMFSPDGQHAVYSQLQPGSSQTEDVHLLHLADSGTTDSVVDARDVVTGWGWSPNGDHFAYASTPGGIPGSGYDLGLAGPIRPWAAGLTQIIDLDWQDATTFYFIGQINNAGWGLYRQTLGAEPALLASGLGSQAGLDARAAP